MCGPRLRNDIVSESSLHTLNSYKASESAYKEFEQTIKGLRSTRDAALNAENERFVAESTRHSKEVVAIESRFITDPTLIAARKVLDAKVAATLEQFYQLCPEARGN